MNKLRFLLAMAALAALTPPLAGQQKRISPVHSAHAPDVDYAMALYPNDPILFGSLKEAGISGRGL